MRLLIGTLLGVGLLVTGCSPAPPSVAETCPAAPVMSEMPPAPDDTEWFEKAAESTLNYAKQLEGFSEAAAESCVTEAGLVWRVVGRDGEWFPVTDDYSPQRVNAVIERSIVTEISIG
jgi:hypothetical protein